LPINRLPKSSKIVDTERKTQNSVKPKKNHYLQESKMSTGNTPKINVRNSVSECAQSLKKENAGKYHNYGIKDCIASIAATKIK
jgi:hypothetical protein